MRKTSIFLLALFVFIPTSYGLFSSLTVKQIDQIDSNTGTYFDINSTGAIKVPVGTVGEQPTGVNGMLRYSTTDNAFEGYVDGAWDAIGGGSSVIASITDSGIDFVGDASLTNMGNAVLNEAVYQRVGDRAFIDMFITIGSTLPTGTLQINMPGYLNIDMTKNIADFRSSAYAYNGGLVSDGSVLITGGGATLNMRGDDDTGGWNATTPILWANTDNIHISFNAPIVGWTTGTTAIVQDYVMKSAIGASNLGTGFTSIITDIPFIEVEDANGIWSGSTFTVPVGGAGYWDISGQVYLSGASTTVPKLYVNTVDTKRKGPVSSSIFKPFNFLQKLEVGDVVSIRMDSTGTLAVGALNHYIDIVQRPPTVNLAVGNRECQTKELSADVTTNITITDLTFSNLEIGKNYTANLHADFLITNGDFSLVVSTVHDGNTIGAVAGGNSGANPIRHIGSDIAEFTATATTVTFTSSSISAGSAVQGNGAVIETHVTLCEELTETTAVH